jgi:hypothetical protein
MSSAPDASALEMDLWPKAKFDSELVTPVSIMRRQAALLGEKTQQLVTAEVSTSASIDHIVHHYFRLVVPALDNYKYQLFAVEHRVEQLYPLEGNFESIISTTIPDQAAFVEWLRRVLSSESTLKKIDSLMAQARG